MATREPSIPGSRWLVGPSGSIPSGGRLTVDCDGVEVCVFNVDGRHHAIENRCPHQGGPICDGRLTGTLMWDDANDAPIWTEEMPILVCPWHGVEFNLDTGSGLCGIQLKLRRRELIDDGEQMWIGGRA